jgi:Capsule polysaccharide biosynthesis protein
MPMSLVKLRELGSKGNLYPDRLDRVLARVRRPLDRAFERRALALDRLTALGADVGARADAAPSAATRARPRILVVSLRGWSAHIAYELVIAHALRLRGADVALLTCGGGMPACELGWARRAHPRPCDRCAWLTNRAAQAAALRHVRLGSLLPWGDDAVSAPARPPAPEMLDAREASAISVAWLLKATLLDRVPQARDVADDFAVAASGVGRATRALLRALEPDIVFLLNGLFGAERMIREVAHEQGIRAPTYEIAPRGGALVLAQKSPAPDYDVDELWEQVRDRPLTEHERSEIVALLRDRARGLGAHEAYYERPEDDPNELRRRLGLAERQPVVSLFTNVTWDSATIGHDIGFSSMFDWIEHTVRIARDRKMVLVVRVHPAEVRWGTREEVQDVITSRLGAIPANVRFVPAHDPISSYALLDISDLLLTYTTTVGLEAAARGKRVAVAGHTHYRGRGFTTDISGLDDLARTMQAPPGPISPESVELALRYAHMFFFRAMIPFPLVEVEGGKVTALPGTAAELAPGADRYLDWICERILDGEHFGLPDELAGHPGRTAS